MREQFVRKVFRELLEQGCLNTTNELLVVAGGRAERELFQTLSFTNVTITNLDSVEAAAHLEPFRWPTKMLNVSAIHPSRLNG